MAIEGKKEFSKRQSIFEREEEKNGVYSYNTWHHLVPSMFDV